MCVVPSAGCATSPAQPSPGGRALRGGEDRGGAVHGALCESGNFVSLLAGAGALATESPLSNGDVHLTSATFKSFSSHMLKLM